MIRGFALQRWQRLSFTQFYTKCVLIRKLLWGFFQLMVKKIVFFPQSSYHSRFYLLTEKKDNCKFSIYKMASPYIDNVYII